MALAVALPGDHGHPRVVGQSVEGGRGQQGIPEDLRPKMQDWIFGCDICQQVCPWNKFSASEGDASLRPLAGAAATNLISTLALTPQSFNRKFKRSPIQRAKRRGLLRNAAVALGNLRDSRALPALEQALDDPEPLVSEHAKWAIEQITNQLPSTNRKS